MTTTLRVDDRGPAREHASVPGQLIFFCGKMGAGKSTLARALARLRSRQLPARRQMLWPEAIGMAVEGIESARFLTPAQKRDIFYNNAARFLRLSGK